MLTNYAEKQLFSSTPYCSRSRNENVSQGRPAIRRCAPDFLGDIAKILSARETDIPGRIGASGGHFMSKGFCLRTASVTADVVADDIPRVGQGRCPGNSGRPASSRVEGLLGLLGGRSLVDHHAGSPRCRYWLFDDLDDARRSRSGRWVPGVTTTTRIWAREAEGEHGAADARAQVHASGTGRPPPWSRSACVMSVSLHVLVHLHQLGHAAGRREHVQAARLDGCDQNVRGLHAGVLGQQVLEGFFPGIRPRSTSRLARPRSQSMSRARVTGPC